ncbi:MAG TPA: hypothetical protein VGC96_12835 [Candidatus Elarobacter sp.]
MIGVHGALLMAALATPSSCAHPNAPVTMDPLPPEISMGVADGARGAATVDITLDDLSNVRTLRILRSAGPLVAYTAVGLSLAGPGLFHTTVAACIPHGRTFRYAIEVDGAGEPRFIGVLHGDGLATIVTVQRAVLIRPDAVIVLPYFEPVIADNDRRVAALAAKLQARGIGAVTVRASARLQLGLELGRRDDARAALAEAAAEGSKTADIAEVLSEAAAASDVGVAEATRAAKDDAARYGAAHDFGAPYRYAGSRVLVTGSSRRVELSRSRPASIPAPPIGLVRAGVTVTAYFP